MWMQSGFGGGFWSAVICDTRSAESFPLPVVSLYFCVCMVVRYFGFFSCWIGSAASSTLFPGGLPERSGLVQGLEIRAELTTWQLMAP